MRAYLITLFIIWNHITFAQLNNNISANVEKVDTINASNLLKDGIEFINNRNLDEALVKLNNSKAIFVAALGKNNSRVADVDYQLGIVYLNKRNIELALESLQSSLTLRVDNLDSNHIDIARSNSKLGVCYTYMGRHDIATSFYLKALEIFKLKLGENHVDVGKIYGNIGVNFDYLGDFNKALEYQLLSINILSGLEKKDNSGIANAYANMGILYDKLGDSNKSIEYYEKAISIFKSLPRVNLFGIANANMNIGVSYYTTQNFDKALEYYEKALSLFIQLRGETHSVVGFCLENMGVIYDLKNNNSKALEYYKRSNSIMIMNLGDNHPNVAGSFHNLGLLHQELRKYKESLNYYDKAVNILLNTYGDKHPLIAQSYVGIGEVFLKTKKYTKAITILDSALYALNFQGIDSFEKVNSMLELINTLKNQANVYLTWYEDTKQIDKLYSANEIYKKALAAIEYKLKEINPLENSISRFILSVNEGAIYTNNLIFNQTDSSSLLNELFLFSEKSKSIMLQQEIRNEVILFNNILPESLIAEEKNLDEAILVQEKKLFNEEYETSSPKDSLITLYKNKLFDLRRKKENFLEVLKNDHPDYHKLKYDFSIITIEDIQQKLSSSQTLIEYFVGDSSLFIFSITSDNYTVKEIKKDFPLDSLIQDLRQNIFEYWMEDHAPSTAIKFNKKYAENAHLLYQKLIAPISENITTELIIIPDGVLGYLPFDVLLKTVPTDFEELKKYDYLIQNHQISYAYSATLLQEMKEKKSNATKGFLAFAPEFMGEPIASRNIQNLRNGLSTLTYNIPEVENINQLVNGEIYTSHNATLSNFLDKVTDYQVIHLSTHGKLDDRVGEFSYLAFSPTSDSIDHQKLYIRDLYNLRLNAEMVVLSACETGLGELQKGEGILSMGRGFTYAGAKSIINTLWSVNDASTQKIMERFYTHLQKGSTKDAALRQAKLDYFNDTENPHPFFWAGFVPVGDMKPIEIINNNHLGLWVGIGVLALLTIFLFIKLKKK